MRTGSRPQRSDTRVYQSSACALRLPDPLRPSRYCRVAAVATMRSLRRQPASTRSMALGSPRSPYATAAPVLRSARSRAATPSSEAASCLAPLVLRRAPTDPVLGSGGAVPRHATMPPPPLSAAITPMARLPARRTRDASSHRRPVAMQSQAPSPRRYSIPLSLCCRSSGAPNRQVAHPETPASRGRVVQIHVADFVSFPGRCWSVMR